MLRRTLALFVGLSLTGIAGADPSPPDGLKSLMVGARHRVIQRLTLDGLDFYAIERQPGVPYLLWPVVDEGWRAKRSDVDPLVARVLPRIFHRSAELEFAEIWNWRGNEVWRYQVVLSGLPVVDGFLDVHWENGRLLGLVHHAPGPVLRLEPAAGAHAGGAGPRANVVLLPVRRGAGYELVQVQRVTRDGPSGRVVTFERDGAVLQRLEVPSKAPSRAATFSEYPLPSGTFPDQIDVDSNGLVWFSQPLNNQPTSFDPVSLTFTSFPGVNSPDGMTVDSADILWTGLYASGAGLGRHEVATSNYTAILPPYASALMAIPLETSWGTLLVTDHQLNRLSEYDPVGAAWLGSEIMPTANCWVVAGVEDVGAATAYFTEYNVDQLGQRPQGGSVTDITVPAGSAPAFDVYHDGKVYFSEWVRNRLGVYDIAANTSTEYTYPAGSGEGGGPIGLASSGEVIVGTRNVGYIMIFDPRTQQFDAHQIPTSLTALKDGLVVSPDNVIWFTESGADQLARLDVSPVARFSGSPLTGPGPLTVDFIDDSSLPASWSWDFGDGSNSTLQSPSHTYTQAGRYTVSLTVANAGGSDTATFVDYVEVTCPALSADFLGAPTAGAVPLTVAFTDLSTGAATYLWDFGDGGTSNLPAPTHTYTTPGVYTVALSVGNGCNSDVHTEVDYIQVRATHEILSGAGPGPMNPPVLKGWDHATPPTEAVQLAAYGASSYGVNVAGGDIQAGATEEMLTGPGPGEVYGPQIRGFQATGSAIARVNLFAYGTLRFGAHVAAADVDGDAHAEILTAPGPGAVFGPHVRGFDYDGAPLGVISRINFFAYGTLRWGARVGGGQLDLEPVFQEIATGAGAGPVFSPHARTFDYDASRITARRSFFAFATGTHGASVAAGDVDGDGVDSLIVGHGPDPASSSEVRGYDLGSGTSPAFSVTPFSVAGGAETSAGDLDGDGTEELLAAPGWGLGNPARVRGFAIGGGTGSPLPGVDFDAYPGQPFGAKLATAEIGIP